MALNVHLVLGCVLILMLSCVACLEIPPSFSEKVTQIQQLHDTFFSDPSVKGSASTALIYKNMTIGEVFSGEWHTNKPGEKPNRDTKYRVASLTKTFVSAAMMVLREEGKINLDDSVLNLVPEFKQFPNPFGKTSNFTFRELSAYMSGLPREPPCVLFDCEFSSEQIVERAKNNKAFLVNDGYGFPIYSNMGYSLLGHALGKAAKLTFEQVISSRILQVLGMSNSGFVTKDNSNTLDLATGYHKNSIIYSNKSISWSQPAAGMYSSLADLSVYVKELLSGVKLFNRQTAREFMSVQHVLHHGSAGVGFSWEIVYFPFMGTWTVLKSGLIGGFNAQIVMVPDYEFAVVTLLSTDDGAESLALQSAAALFPVVKDFADNQRMNDMKSSLPSNVQEFVGEYSQNTSISYVNSTFLISGLKGVSQDIPLSFLGNGKFRMSPLPLSINSFTNYKTGLDGSVIDFGVDTDNFTSNDIQAGLFSYMKENSNLKMMGEKSHTKRSIEQSTQLPYVCNLIPENIHLSKPFDKSITDAFSLLSEQVNNITEGSAVVKVTYRGETVFEFSKGNVTSSSLFRIGSVTQIFSALSVLIANEKGFIKSLDDPVSNYIQNTLLFNEPIQFGNNVTFRQLMMHASGLPSGSPCDPLNCNLDWSDYLNNAITNLNMIYPSFGSSRVGSVVGFAILGNTITSVTGIPFADFVTQQIIQPLQLIDTGFNYTQEVLERLVKGKDKYGNEISSINNLSVEEAAVQMFSSASDLSKLLSCIASTVSECFILKKESSRLMMLRSFSSNDRLFSTGLGWEHYFDASTRAWMTAKSGEIQGYGSFVASNAEMGLNIVLLTSVSQPTADNLAKQVFPQIFYSFMRQVQSAGRKNINLPSTSTVEDMIGVYKVFDQFLLHTQYLQISHDKINSVIFLSFLKGPEPAESLPMFALDLMSESDLMFKVKTLETLSCMGNVLTGIEGCVVKFERNNEQKIVSFIMPTLNYGSPFVKMIPNKSTSLPVHVSGSQKQTSISILLVFLVALITFIHI